jgi:G3E family GTPase
MKLHPPADLIPVTLITGFLGSGKTTVLNHLVQQHELADALVIINEFGEMALDHLLVAHSVENLTLEMSSGCLCCTIRSDLAKTLRDITWRFARNGQRQFRRVLIETTGLADPAPILHTLMTDPALIRSYRLDGIVATIDMASGAETLVQHAEAVKQAAMADALLLTKSDLATDAQRVDLLNRLGRINPAAARWPVQHGEISPQNVLNLGLFTADGKLPDVARWLKEEAYLEASANRVESEVPVHCNHGAEDCNHGADEHSHNQESGCDPGQAGDAHGGHHPDTGHSHSARDINRHDAHIRAHCFRLATPLREEDVYAWLNLLKILPDDNILRMKGILHIEGQPRPLAVHSVQHILHPPVLLPAWPSEDRLSRLVFITRNVERPRLESLLRASLGGVTPIP